MSIPVYVIVSKDPNASYVTNLVALFDTDTFHTTIIFCEDEQDPCYKDRKNFTVALSDAQEKYNDSPCIIVKDDMFSNLSKYDMETLIKKILSSNVAWDLCYLYRYADTCDGSILIPNLISGGSLVSTKNAEGDNAIMFSPKARDMVLQELGACSFSGKDKGNKHDNKHHKKCKSVSSIINELLRKGSLLGVATSPLALSYNTIFKDFKKTHECIAKQPQPNNNNNTYAWSVLLILGVILLIVLIWLWWRR